MKCIIPQTVLITAPLFHVLLLHSKDSSGKIAVNSAKGCCTAPTMAITIAKKKSLKLMFL